MINRATPFSVQGEQAGITYRCPGCGSLHSVYTAKRFEGHKGFHAWNGDLAEPTLMGPVHAHWTGCEEYGCKGQACDIPEHQRRHICRHTVRKGHATYTEASTGRTRSAQLPGEF